LKKIDADGTIERRPGSGRKRTVRTTENVQLVEELVLNQESQPGTYHTVRQIARETKVPKSSVRQWRPLSSSSRSSTRWTTQTLGVVTSCHSHGRTLDSQSRQYLWWTLMLLSDLTKLGVAVADVDRFC